MSEKHLILTVTYAAVAVLVLLTLWLLGHDLESIKTWFAMLALILAIDIAILGNKHAEGGQ